jgi:hypothetical protein
VIDHTHVDHGEEVGTKALKMWLLYRSGCGWSVIEAGHYLLLAMNEICGYPF